MFVYWYAQVVFILNGIPLTAVCVTDHRVTKIERRPDTFRSSFQQAKQRRMLVVSRSSVMPAKGTDQLT